MIFEDNYALNGGGVMVNGGSPVIKDCVFIGNDGHDGGAFMCLNGDNPVLDGCVFYDNTAVIRGAAISGQAVGCTINIVSCTIAHNSSTVGSAIAAWENDYTIDNSIIAYNGDSLAVWSFGDSASVAISYTDVFGNIGGDWEGPIEGQETLNGNIHDAPLFIDPANRDYHLTRQSPCIDSGNPDLPNDPDNTTADMGAYFYDQMVSVDDWNFIPASKDVLTNYPNPFNAVTTIQFELSSNSSVKLNIYDIAGRKVATLVDGTLDAGSYQVNWGGDVVSGVYFSVLSTEKGINSNKMLLIK
jgi:hypothetical protein